MGYIVFILSFDPPVCPLLPTGTLLAPYSDSLLSKNCKFPRIALKYIFATFKLRLGYDLPISVNDRVILSFHEGLFARNFAFTEINPRRNLQYIAVYSVSVTLSGNSFENKVRRVFCIKLAQILYV